LTADYPQLSGVNEDLSNYPKELKASAYSDGESKADIPSIDSVLFRDLAVFFSGFLLALYGVFIYDQRGCLAYMIFAFDYRGVSISQSDDEDNGENFQHNSAIVPTDRIPVDFKLGNSQGGESLDVRCQI
jgi:hypothetical protein